MTTNSAYMSILYTDSFSWKNRSSLKPQISYILQHCVTFFCAIDSLQHETHLFYSFKLTFLKVF